MAFQFVLKWGTTPFCMDQGYGMGDDFDPKSPPVPCFNVDLVEKINEILSFDYLEDFAIPNAYPGKNLSAVARLNELGPFPNSHQRVGDWYYPTGASRWSVFRGLATSSQVKAMLLAAGGGANPSWSNPLPFTMQAVPVGASLTSTATKYALTSNMYLLPPRPLAEHGGNFDGLFLVTLVDERYYWQGTPVSLKLVNGTTWLSLINQIAGVLGISLTTQSAIQSVYGTPESDSQLWTNAESTPTLLDALAANVGRTVVRNLDGTYTLLTPAESQGIALTNRGPVANLVRNMGGDIFNSGGKLKAGNLTPAKNAVIPATVHLVYPKYVLGNDPVPHFANTRYGKDRPTSWFEDSFGDAYRVDVPIASGGSFVSGLAGNSDLTFRDTAKALYSGEVQLGNDPINKSGLVSLSMQIANDYYANQVSIALDEVYPGTYGWTPEGIHDVIWTYSSVHEGACTRVLHPSWTQEVPDYQHSTPLISGFTSVPGGVGGHSVALNVRDATGASGTALGASGGTQSGVVMTTLNQTLNSGSLVASFSRYDFFPTQNRWRGAINGEKILFEGTSGGVGGSFSGSVQIVYRGIDGTVQTQQATNSLVTQLTPDTAYGVNLISHEKGQFVYPSQWQSGGIQGVNIVPQTQTVKVLDGTGITVSGVLYQSGQVQNYDPTQSTSGPWLPTDFVWVTERNNTALAQGALYEGQFVGYSPSVSGIVAPIYSTNAVGNTQFTVQGNQYNTTKFSQPLKSHDTKIVVQSVNGWSPTLRNLLKTEVFYNSGVFSGVDSIESILTQGTSGGLNSGQVNSGWADLSGNVLAGGVDSGYGFFVDIIQRNVYSSPLSFYASGFDYASGVSIGGPFAISGANQLTDQGQYINPGTWGSVKEVIVQRQMDIVTVLAGSGLFTNVGFGGGTGSGLLYSGTSPLGLCWVINQNQNKYTIAGLGSGQLTGPASGENYLAKFDGFSRYMSGSSGQIPVVPIYSVCEKLPETAHILAGTRTNGGRGTATGPYYFGTIVNWLVDPAFPLSGNFSWQAVTAGANNVVVMPTNQMPFGFGANATSGSTPVNARYLGITLSGGLPLYACDPGYGWLDQLTGLGSGITKVDKVQILSMSNDFIIGSGGIPNLDNTAPIQATIELKNPFTPGASFTLP